RTVFMVFFFQAEDGIRDFHVTGVQTCALPIYGLRLGARLSGCREHAAALLRPVRGTGLERIELQEPGVRRSVRAGRRAAAWARRSEERRGGEESRSRVAPRPSTSERAATEDAR